MSLLLTAMQTPHQQRVAEFMQRAEQAVPISPQDMLPDAVRLLRARLILEEALETIKQGLGVSVSLSTEEDDVTWELANGRLRFAVNGPFDLVETCDGCADLNVVVNGTLIACGVPDDPIQRMVDENNLAKFAPGYRIDEHGKLQEPPGHVPPDLAGLLNFLKRALSLPE